jgi:hypothetical protein
MVDALPDLGRRTRQTFSPSSNRNVRCHHGRIREKSARVVLAVRHGHFGIVAPPRAERSRQKARGPFYVNEVALDGAPRSCSQLIKSTPTGELRRLAG